MMLPSAFPMIALYGAIQRRAAGEGTKGAPVYVAHAFLMTLAGLGRSIPESDGAQGSPRTPS